MSILEGIQLDQVTGYGVLVVIALLVITDKLVWHSRLEKAEKRVERLEGMLDRALGVSERSVVGAEVAADVVSKLPDPAQGGS